MKTLFLSFFLAVTTLAVAQPGTSKALATNKPARGVVQFSGVVVDGDSLKAVPFVAVIIKNTNRGTFADVSGYFSFVAQPGDTISFVTLGYKNAEFVLPDTLKDTRYSLIQLLKRDTIELKEAVIYPWPTKEQFKDAFLKLNAPDDDLARAQKNLKQQALIQSATNISADGSMNYKSGMQQRSSQMYYAGQLPPNNLLNPIAWSKFIQAWRNGSLKKQ